MPQTTRNGNTWKGRLKKLVGSLVSSRVVGWIVNFPPIAWLVRTAGRAIARRQIDQAPVGETPVEIAAGVGLEATLQQIVYDVVTALGYAGAMVATYEQGDSLPVRALYIDPSLATEEQIHQWEEQVSQYSKWPVSITDPVTARVFVYQNEYRDNLGVRAFEAGGPVVSDDLYDLFRPIAPFASRPIIKGVQQALDIEQVIAVPFFLEASIDGQAERMIVGNLFAAKQGRPADTHGIVG